MSEPAPFTLRRISADDQSLMAGDAAAIALYNKLGVREDVLHFDIPV